MITMPSSVRSHQSFAEIDPLEFDRLIASHRDEIAGSDGLSPSLDGTEQRGCAVAQFDMPRAKAGQVRQVPKPPTQEAIIRHAFEIELLKSGYPLDNVQCHCNESTLVLRGRVCRYYYLQMAIQIALRLAGGRRIVHEIEVIAVVPDDDRQRLGRKKGG